METLTEIDRLKEIYNNYKESALKDFFTFLKFESISSEEEYKAQTHACADWVADYLKKLGFEIEMWPTQRHPTIFAKYCKAGPKQPTLLIYNHYDVQPVDPLELWQTPPFEPTVRKGEIYARGAQDNKGQCFYVLLTLKALIETYGELPINIKLCIEGEEECGSAGLSQLVKNKREQLKADYLAIVDLGIHDMTKPAITLGLRGLVTMDVEVTSTHTDLHSGSHGGIAFNPIHALTKMLANVRNAEGKITIPGFYEDVKPISKEEKSQVSFDFSDDEYNTSFGAKPTGGEKGFTPLERNWTRPTFEINGIAGGYYGNGFKTVIPAKAIAKISCRLVPDQQPEKIGQLVANYLQSQAPEGTKVFVKVHPGVGKAVRAHVESPVAKAFAKAYSDVFQAHCEFIYSGASIPVVPELTAACGGEVVMVGVGLPGDCIHAPNEHFGVERIEKGFLTMARALQLLKRTT